MGEQFWWFYDVIAAAAVLVCIFLSVRSGLIKAATSIICFILSFVIALSVSSMVADAIYEQATKNGNVKELTPSLESKSFTVDLKKYLEGLGYNVRIDQQKLDKAFHDDLSPDTKIYEYLNNINNKKVDEEAIFMNKLHEGYAYIVSDYIAQKLSPYAAEYAAEQVRKQPMKVYELDKLMQIETDEETMRDAAEFISETYLKVPYTTQLRLISFCILFLVLGLISIGIEVATSRYKEKMSGLVPNFMCILIGVVKGAIMIVAIACVVRLYVVLGSNKMLFFNHEAIEQTYIFKYFYNFIKGF